MLALVSLFMPSGVAKAEEPSTTWDTLTQQVSELTSGQHTFNIDADLTLTSESKPLTVPNGVAITLAGTGSITGLNLPAIQVESGGTLTLAGLLSPRCSLMLLATSTSLPDPSMTQTRLGQSSSSMAAISPWAGLLTFLRTLP